MTIVWWLACSVSNEKRNAVLFSFLGMTRFCEAQPLNACPLFAIGVLHVNSHCYGLGILTLHA